MKKFIVEVPETTFRKIMKKKEDDGYGDRDLGDYFTFLFKDVHLQLTEGEMIGEATKENLFGLWMDNFAENIPFIRKGNTLDKLVPQEPDKVPKQPSIVVGAGPSILKYKQLELLGESSFTGTIVACDSMLTKCLEKGIIPDITISVDGAEIISKFYESELVKQYGSKLKVMLISTVHPKVRDACLNAGVQIFWYHGIFDDWRSPESYTRLIKLMTKTQDKPHSLANVSCLGNAGATAWITSHALLRASPICLLGIDMGYPEGYPLEQTYYFSTYLKAAGGDVSKALMYGYREVYNPFFKCKVIQDPVFRHYTQAWLESAKQTEPWVVTVNASPESALFSYDGTINCMRFEDFLQYYKDVNMLKQHFLKMEGTS